MAKIIIIDDDENFGALVLRWLTRAGFEASFQNRPLGTLNALVKGKFDLVILDVHMPAMHGPRLIKLIRETEGIEKIKILLCSMMPKDELRKVAGEAGVRAYITKSSSQTEFISAVRAALAESS
jgi:two-component system, OmpR family, response regulator